ncbi:MAG: [protein-PII] uridylyltransferase [Alphaproteobacteria bacterium]
MPKRPMFAKTNVVAIPERMAAPANIVDGEKLRRELTAFSGPTYDRAGVLGLLKTAREDALDFARRKFEAGHYNGHEMARVIAAIHDDVISALFDFTREHILPMSGLEPDQALTLCAVGGYGRGEMAPGSDVDLLFLLNDNKGNDATERLTEYILYMLWDMGIKVGHATRSIEQNIKLAKTDQTILTSLLDVRFLCGDEAMALQLFTRFRKDITRGKGRDYIAAKLDERDTRHEREGNSRYVIEPNVKEGKGGLRDLHVLYWIARFLDKDGKISDAQSAEDYVEMGLFDEAAATRFVRAADFLWRTRIHLHFTAGRPAENLTFDRQTVLARKMGYAAGPVEEAVEKFMREYFINAREVGALTRIACAKLEAEKSIRLPKGLDALLPNSRRKLKEDGFILDHGRITFKDPMQIREKPALIMELFEVAGRRNLDIHPDALSDIDFRRNLIDNNFRRNPEIAKLFLDMLLGSKAPYATLKIMNECGVLGRYVLEFGGIVARTQFNMHHAYTVDEHTLKLIGYFHDIEQGNLANENPLTTKVVQAFEERQRRILYMACLLHDTGKGVGDQCIEGARLARRACRRLGMEQSEIESVAWLVRRHLDLSETAQRRDISDPDTIKEFGSLIGSKSRLDMLLALTVVDIRAVGPGIWNDWKGVLLQGLYRSTAAFLEGKSELEPAAKARAAQEQLKDRLSPEMAARIAPVLSDLGEAYWLGFGMAEFIRHARFFDSAIEAGQNVAVHTRRDRPRDITELWILGQDRVGLFADLAMAISSTGAQIVGARLHTGENKRVMNVFYLQNAEGFAFGRASSHILEVLRQRALGVIQGKVETYTIDVPALSRRAAAIPVESEVSVHDTPSETVSIIEIECRDRPGLLYLVADCLRHDQLDVLSAHIEVVGTRAIDAFYVSTLSGEPLEKARIVTIRTALLTVLKADDLAAAS